MIVLANRRTNGYGEGMRKTSYIASLYNSNEEIGRAPSQREALYLVAAAWSCPVEALCTSRIDDYWTIRGPEGQLCGTITRVQEMERSWSSNPAIIEGHWTSQRRPDR